MTDKSNSVMTLMAMMTTMTQEDHDTDKNKEANTAECLPLTAIAEQLIIT